MLRKLSINLPVDNMSQQSSQSQPTSDLDENQERQQNVINESLDDSCESARTQYSLLHPGSIDWFVLRQFLILFLGTMILISIIFIIMDYLNSADVFNQKCQQHNISLPIALYHFYMPRLLVLFDALLTACVILPSIILINQMVKHNETLALACMGIRRVRAAYMIFVASIVFIAIFALCREFVLPAQRSVIGCDINSFFDRDKARVEPKTDPLTSVYITGEALDLDHNAIIQPSFNMPVITLDKYGQTISADIAIWKEEILGDSTTPNRPAGFLLKNVVAEKCLDNQPSIDINDKTILYTPVNHDWLKKGECFLVSGIEFDDLTLNAALQEYSSISELRRIMERMPDYQIRDAAITLHKRMTRPFIDFCIIFVGLSFILANDNRLLLILLKAALWWGCSWIIINMFSALAGDSDKLISPAMAAWIPLILFSAMAAYVWDKVYY